MKRILNKWQLVISFHKRYEYLDGRRTFVFGVFKLTSLPPEGVIPDKRHYKGFILAFTMLFKRGW